jgi:hypothetical protein
MTRTLLFIVILLGSALVAGAQSRGADNSTPMVPGIDKKKNPLDRYEEEFYRRAEIRRGEEAHKEMLSRAQEGTQLARQLRAGFDQRPALGVEELKKLERLESLAKKIRGGAGGSDDDEPLRDVPNDTGAALRVLADATEDLLKKVEKTSRLVTSAAVVERANEVIELSKHIRKLFR